ncbi:hypothetical protein NEHOM01_1206 [Nematocida homosporus]|uniref:uncharacterized protein n=1 Tax=Nematocida homosporus TaxID=1912981 RepID=UPI0022203294|nr:uncharacterized protein NEHOM01_1206 [Nematocida homosporus]KAI5185983.1 hypothetical protein NEHOM01_1206 [Nematocida homosporus]
MFLLFVLKTFVIGLVLVASAVGFVTFLYKAIHYIEEYPARAKEKIRYLVYAVCALHVLLFLRGFGILMIGFSIICQLLFFNLLNDYPNIETSGAGFISAVAATFINHMVFLSAMLRNKTGILEIFFYFFVIVWTVPFAFFLSLTANDDVISIPGAKKPIRRTVAGKVIDLLLSRSSIWEDR